MNNCTEFIDKISAYADGELSDDERQILEKHISGCPHCSALLDFYGEISASLDESEVPVPENFAGDVMVQLSGGGEEKHAAFGDEIKPPLRGKLTLKAALTRYIPAAACLAVILLAAPRLSGLGCKSAILNEASLSGGAPPAVMEDAGEFDAPLPHEDLYSESTAVQDIEREFAAQAPAGGAEMGEALPEETRARDEEMTDGELAERYKTENLFAVIVIRGTTLPESAEILYKEDADGGVLLLYITRASAQALIESGYYSEVLDENSQEAVIVYLP